jgi:hypothetical protein
MVAETRAPWVKPLANRAFRLIDHRGGFPFAEKSWL